MKKYLVLLLTIALTSCGGGGDSLYSQSDTSHQETSSEPFSFDDYSYDPSEEIVEAKIKDGPILHAWDWSVSQVIERLDDIEKANYKAIQLSPMQPSKSRNANDPWWNIYQPLGFKVSTDNESPIGNKNQLKELCSKAEAKDIDIIMDVVCNHLSSEWNGAYLSEAVKNFEPEIYDKNLIHDCSSQADDHNLESIVHGRIGLVSIDTGNKIVQSRITSMLKDYIDCGVKGFRFDAAKHIETPDDGKYASDFWPVVTDTIYTYGEEKFGEKPFIYGEILYTPGDGRSWDSYTKYMSLVDNSQGSSALNSVIRGDAGAISAHVNVGQENAVLWAESHDTYENKKKETTDVDPTKLDLTYAMQISHNQSTALYFARPKDNYEIDKAPQVISGPSDNYKSALISAANKLHNDFVGGNESPRVIDGKAINIRSNSSGTNFGILIADPKFGSSVDITIPSIPDGEYTNLVNNEKVNVSNGKVKANLVQGGAVLEKYTSSSDIATSVGLSIRTENDKLYFSDTLNVQIDVVNGTDAYYTINGASKTNFNDKATFTLGKGEGNGTYLIEVFAKNDKGEVKKKSLTVTKSDLLTKAAVLTNVPEDSNVFAWVWQGSGEGHWVGLSSTGTTWILERNQINEEDSIIFALCKKEYNITIENMKWGSNYAQTENLSLATQMFDYESINWRR